MISGFTSQWRDVGADAFERPGVGLEFPGEPPAGAEQHHFYMCAGFARHPRDFGNVHSLGILQPNRLKLNLRKHPPRCRPQTLAFFVLDRQLTGIVQIGLFGDRFITRRNLSPGPMEIYAFAPRDGKQPRGESEARIELAQRRKDSNKSVLRNFPRVANIAAGLENKTVTRAS